MKHHLLAHQVKWPHAADPSEELQCLECIQIESLALQAPASAHTPAILAQVFYYFTLPYFRRFWR